MSKPLEQRVEYWLQYLTLRIALPIAAIVVFLIAWNRGVALLYGMSALLVATLLIARLAPRFNLAGVAASRTNPVAAHEGDTVTLELEVRTAGYLPRYMLELVDCLPFASAGQQSPMVFMGRVQGNVKRSMEVLCDLRGEHELGPLQLQSAYPLGVHRVQRTLDASRGKLLVYPKPFTIRSLPLVGASQSPIMGMQAASVARGNGIFFGIREYRHGDSLRHVHWAATARRNAMVVKEYEYVQSTEVAIVLDLDRDSQYGSGKHSTLEYAVKIAASVARYALANGHLVSLAGLGLQPVEVPAGRGAHHYQRILEVLARVQADGNTPYREAVNRAAARLACGGIMFQFEHGIPQKNAWEKQQMFRHHIRPIRVRFDVASFDNPQHGAAQQRKWSMAGNDYFVRSGDELARVFAL